MDKSVFKLIGDDQTSDLFWLSVEFNDNNDFDLTIFKKPSAWFATVAHQNICLQAKQLEIDANEYLQKLQEYVGNTPSSVSLIFNNEHFIINCILQNNMKVVYFTHKLEKINYNDSAETLLNKFYTQRNNLLEKLTKLNEEKKEFERSENDLQQKLNELIDRKKTEEDKLFSNFVLVLNEKKRRIQHLDELLEAFKRGRPSTNPSVEIKKRTKKLEPVQQIKSEKEIVSESDSDENYDTDEEKSKTAPNADKESDNQNRNDAYAIPGTSKFDLFADDSPPRHLPKRIKSEAAVDNNSHIKPSTSKDSKKEKLSEKTDSKPEDPTPNINFSTQDLLDNI